ALLELGFVDLVDGAPERAAVCLTYACDFRRLDGDRAGAAAIAAAGADWMSDDGYWEPAVRLWETALGDAAAAGETLLAAQRAARRRRAASDAPARPDGVGAGRRLAAGRGVEALAAAAGRSAARKFRTIGGDGGSCGRRARTLRSR